MSDNLVMIIAAVGGIAALLVFTLIGVVRFYWPVEKGTALIVSTTSGQRVVFDGGVLVLPVMHRAEAIDLAVKTIAIDRRGRDGLVCNDNIRVDIRVVFLVRINRTAEDVLRVAESIGSARAANQETLEQLFTAKFTEAMKSVGKQFGFDELCARREQYRDHVIELIGRDLNGYVLDDAAIEVLEQTPLSALDPNNMLDAEGIRRITERTALENVRANEVRQRERLEILAQNVAADAAVARLEEQRAEAEARHRADIAAYRR